MTRFGHKKLGEPPHVEEDGDCPCTSCDYWRKEQCTPGSLVRSINRVRTISGHKAPIWKPGTEASWDIRMDDQIAIVVDRNFTGVGSRSDLDCILILIANEGIWVTAVQWVVVISKGVAT